MGRVNHAHGDDGQNSPDRSNWIYWRRNSPPVGDFRREICDNVPRATPESFVDCEAYPSVRIAEGDLDDVEIVEKEASEADIVIHLASTKHVPSCNAIIRGLSTTGRSAPGYWIQMSGASLFSAEEIKSDTYGEAAGKFYDNLKDADEIRSIISSSPSRVVDNLVLAQQPSSIKTALVVGPLIYGRGRGPGNTRSIQGPESAKYTLQQGQGFRLSAGKSVWSNVHVRDVGSLICLLVSAATAKKEGIWNQDGIYLPENGHMAFGDLTA
ncbi:hypothetical protein CLAIMM_02015 [Cladophialophora immunda]|nr:hypothetical protein CLAIMM_02015 [Cladophialophora immunda]